MSFFPRAFPTKASRSPATRPSAPETNTTSAIALVGPETWCHDEPQSAAAAFYLGYTYYKIAEPTRRLTPNKQKALELFDKAFELDPAFTPVWQSKK